MNNTVKFSVVIHTEEEFDWSAGFFQKNNTVTHTQELNLLCQDMVRQGACVTLAMDFAFISNDKGAVLANELKSSHYDNIELATHLHPWVNPPYATDLNTQTLELDSYPGNLSRDFEQQKLLALTQAIETQTGYRPNVYLAGRYGVGNNTYAILKELNYTHDVSITPFTDYSHQQGPNFSNYTNQRIIKNDIVCIPHTSGYISLFGQLSDWLNSSPANLPKLNNTIIGKVILRLLGVERVRLSAEGFSAKKMQKLSESLVRIGVDHLIYSFHSSTSKLGGSPYSADEKALTCFKHNNTAIIAFLAANYCPSFVNSSNAAKR